MDLDLGISNIGGINKSSRILTNTLENQSATIRVQVPDFVLVHAFVDICKNVKNEIKAT